jgi:hypothetical protein
MNKTWGGKRENAGRKMKTSEDTRIISQWFNAVLLASELEKINIFSAWDSLHAELESWTEEKRKEVFEKNGSWGLGKQSSWYCYQKGQRRPGPDILFKFDKYIEARNQGEKELPKHPFRWFVKKSGKVKTCPVWAWSPLSFKNPLTNEKEIENAAQAHAKFYKELHGEDTQAYLVESGLLNPDLAIMEAEKDFDFAWPSVMLLPSELAECCNKHNSLPFPYLYDSIPISFFTVQPQPSVCGTTFEISTKQLIEHFVEWSWSAKAEMASGEIWMKYILEDLDSFFNFSYCFPPRNKDRDTAKAEEQEVLLHKMMEFKQILAPDESFKKEINEKEWGLFWDN